MSEVGGRGDVLIERLRDSGYRLTPQRLALIHVLAEDGSHPSAEQVYTRLRGAFPTMSLATVYNTLDVLVGLGEALTLDLSDGGTRYDVKRPVAHPHLVCRSCGRVEDLDLPGVDDLAAAARLVSGYAELRPRVYFEGLCPLCHAASAEERQPGFKDDFEPRGGSDARA